MRILHKSNIPLLLNISRKRITSRSICATSRMDKISDVSLTPISESKYIRPQRIFYNQDGKKKAWDAMKVHDSVAILIHNTDQDVFVFVKQFRPAVYISKATITEDSAGRSVIDHDKFPGSIGITYELCAGITDKDAPVVQIAKEEVLEETGYDAPIERFEQICAQRSGVGVSGANQTLYYVTVTDAMKTAPGGGCVNEGEFIETAEIPIAKEEVLEETGYDAPMERFEQICAQRSGVGVSGANMTLYYVAVTDAMKTAPGGGCVNEGEFIETAEIPVKDSLSFTMNDEITKPIAMMFALLWYHQFKAK